MSMWADKKEDEVSEFLVPSSSRMFSPPRCTDLVLLECLSWGLTAKILETKALGTQEGLAHEELCQEAGRMWSMSVKPFTSILTSALVGPGR